MDIVNVDMNEMRRFNLQEWINTNYDGVQAKFLRATKLNQGEISGILSGKRPLGEKKARNIEIEAGLPEKWLEQINDKFFQDSKSILHAQNTGGGTQNNLLGNTINSLNNTVANGGTQYNLCARYDLLKNSLVKIIPDDSFAPNIPNGSKLTINQDDTNVIDGKIYYIKYGGLEQIRRLFLEGNNQIRLSPDNKKYRDATTTIDQVTIMGRVVQWTVVD